MKNSCKSQTAYQFQRKKKKCILNNVAEIAMKKIFFLLHSIYTQGNLFVLSQLETFNFILLNVSNWRFAFSIFCGSFEWKLGMRKLRWFVGVSSVWEDECLCNVQKGFEGQGWHFWADFIQKCHTLIVSHHQNWPKRFMAF